MNENSIEMIISIKSLITYGATHKMRALEYADDDQELYEVYERRWLAAETIIAAYAMNGDRQKARDLIDDEIKHLEKKESECPFDPEFDPDDE